MYIKRKSLNNNINLVDTNLEENFIKYKKFDRAYLSFLFLIVIFWRKPSAILNHFFNHSFQIIIPLIDFTLLWAKNFDNSFFCNNFLFLF